MDSSKSSLFRDWQSTPITTNRWCYEETGASSLGSTFPLLVQAPPLPSLPEVSEGEADKRLIAHISNLISFISRTGIDLKIELESYSWNVCSFLLLAGGDWSELDQVWSVLELEQELYLSGTSYHRKEASDDADKVRKARLSCSSSFLELSEFFQS